MYMYMYTVKFIFVNVHVQLQLSEDRFEALHGEAFDLGTITEVLEELLAGPGQQLSITLPSYNKVHTCIFM